MVGRGEQDKDQSIVFAPRHAQGGPSADLGHAELAGAYSLTPAAFARPMRVGDLCDMCEWRRIGRWLAGLLAVVAFSAAASAAPRVVAVGDLHGDFIAWRAIAHAAGLVDAAGRWTGGRTILVQTGDVVDRGPDSLDIINDLMRLQREANRAGGQVIALVGNHEAMNVTDDLRYVTPADFAAFATADSAALRERVFVANEPAITAAYRRRDPAATDAAIRAAWLAATPLGMIEHQSAWHPQGRIGRWVIHNPAVVLIDGTIFVHGGISADYSSLPIDEINRRVAAALATRDAAATSIIDDPRGPLWYRGLVVREPSTVGATQGPTREQELATALAAYGAQRMVVAHTPVLTGIAFDQGGKLIRIDTGISIYFGGALSWLEIADGRATAHDIPRPETDKGERR